MRVSMTRANFPVKKLRRLEHEQYHPFHRCLQIRSALKTTLNKEFLFVFGERASKCPFRKALAKFTKSALELECLRGDSCQFMQMGHDKAGHLDGCVGRGLIPCPRNRRPTLVADTAIIRRE